MWFYMVRRKKEMIETNPESAPTEGSAPPRKLVCLVLGEEVERDNMKALRLRAQEIVDELGDPRGGPYHIWVREGETIINQFALCHPRKKREHVVRA